MAGVWQDIKWGFRSLAKSPFFTLIVVLTIALGTGANSAIFSIVNGVLLRPLPFPEADRVVMLWETEKGQEGKKVPVAPADYFDWREQAETFESMAGFHPWSASLTGQEEPERISGAAVAAEFFEVLQIQPALGRFFTPEEDRPGAEPVVVLSHGIWQRRFGGDESILESQVLLDAKSYAVVGIMPAGFTIPEKADFWRPLGQTPESATRGFQFLQVVGTVPPGHQRNPVAEIPRQAGKPPAFRTYGVEAVAVIRDDK